MKTVILASASPRRREILTQVGITFTVMPGEQEENIKERNPERLVQLLSEQKAAEIERRTAVTAERAEPVLIIGADTVVALDDEILGKPKNEEDACRMLRKLSGRTHQVFTGVTLISRSRDGKIKRKTFAVCTSVSVAVLTEEQIQRYVSTGEPADKAGAYAIQGKFAAFIEEFHGDYYNIVGLPIAAVCREAAKLGWPLV